MYSFYDNLAFNHLGCTYSSQGMFWEGHHLSSMDISAYRTMFILGHFYSYFGITNVFLLIVSPPKLSRHPDSIILPIISWEVLLWWLSLSLSLLFCAGILQWPQFQSMWVILLWLWQVYILSQFVRHWCGDWVWSHYLYLHQFPPAYFILHQKLAKPSFTLSKIVNRHIERTKRNLSV